MRIFRKEILRPRADVGEIAAPATRDEDLGTCVGVMLQQRHARAASTRRDRTHKPRCTRANNNHIKLHGWLGSIIAVRLKKYLRTQKLSRAGLDLGE